MDNTVSLDLERIQRAATLLLFQNMNTQIAAQNTLWDARDATFYAALGRTDPSITVESIPPDNFYPGTIPSLIVAPLERYPNVCCIAYVAVPQQTDNDWGELYRLTLGVEMMVKSERSEEEVNARIQRTVEAAHAVFTSDANRRLPEGSGGENLVWQLGNTPVASIGDVFVRHEGTDASNRWYWQGGRLEYIVDRYVDY